MSIEGAAQTSRQRAVRGGVSILVLIVVFAALWELYKVVWTQMEWSWPVRPDNIAIK